MARQPAPEIVKRYQSAKSIRSRNENDWRMASAYCLPRHYAAWQTDGPVNMGGSPTAATRRIAYDSTGVLALPKYAAVLEHLATPHSMRWHGLMATDSSLMRKTRVKNFFDQLTDLLFTMRYVSRANFRQAVSEVYLSMGVYGTGPIYVGQRTPNALSRAPSLLYKACPLRDVFILVNDEGEVDTVFRRFWLTVRQFQLKFPEQGLPPCVASATANGATPKDDVYFEFIHCVYPRNDYEPGTLGVQRHPITGSYICVPDQMYIGDEQGFRSLPYLTPRTFTEAGDPYGFSPAVQALPALGSASAMKKTNLRQGQRAADPTLLAHDDGVVNGGVDLRPAAINYGGVNAQGQKLIHALDSGNFQVSEKMLQGEQADINDSFFVFLFNLLDENKEMTATEVVEKSSKESVLLSPTMGRLQSELLGPDIEREIDVLTEMGYIADSPNGPGLQMPPELIEAKGNYQIIYTSAMAKSVYADEISGFMRSVEMSLNIANATQNPGQLDHYNFDVAIPEISNYLAVPTRWMNDDAQKQAIQENRDKQQQQEQIMKNAAPIAGALKTAQQMQQGTPGGAPAPPVTGQ